MTVGIAEAGAAAPSPFPRRLPGGVTAEILPPGRPLRSAPPVLAITQVAGAVVPAALPDANRLLPPLSAAGMRVLRLDRSTGLDGPSRLDELLFALRDALEALCGEEGVPAFNLLGVGEAGLLALALAALEPERVQALALVQTPVDFAGGPSVDSRVFASVGEGGPEDIDRHVALLAHLSAPPIGRHVRLDLPFGFLPQTGSARSGAAGTGAAGSGPGGARARSGALFRSAEHAAAAIARDWQDGFHAGNGLMLAEPAFAGVPVDPARITMPVLNVYAEHDRVVPAGACAALAVLVGTEDYTEHVRSAGPAGLGGQGDGRERLAVTLADWYASRAPRAARAGEAASHAGGPAPFVET